MDVPEPILEVGDFVRLKEPYVPMLDTFYAEGIERTLKRLVWDEIDPDDHPFWEGPDDVALGYFGGRDDRPSCLEFTHGTVAEVTSRYPPTSRTTPGGSAVQYADDNHDTNWAPPRNVSLHLYNGHGIVYGGGHPTEPIKPEFVDYHVAYLVLIHKARDTWGNEYELDLTDAYGELGFGEPGSFDPWRTD